MLPPRKRAKTEEEKEQRKHERVMRNRKAAHASREKKRRYIEHLESHIKMLTDNVLKYKHNQDVLKQSLLSNGITVKGLKPVNADIPEFQFDTKSSAKLLSSDQSSLVENEHDYGPGTPLTDSSTGVDITSPVISPELEPLHVQKESVYTFEEPHEPFDLMLNYISPASINDSPINTLDPNDLHNSEVVVFCSV